MKKYLCLILGVVLAISLLAGCGEGTADGIYRIAIVQQLDHTSMDQIRDAVTARLEAIGQSEGIAIEWKNFSGANDASLLNQIGAQVVSGDYDAVIPIGTLAAQCMVTATEGTNIPVIFAAVSDPEAAGLTGLSRVTGTSDALNTPFILDMMLAVDPDIGTVGLLYSNSEPNSAGAIAEARAYLDSKGIAYIEKTGNNAGEVLDAVSALAERVGAVFTPTDNVIMASEGAVAEILNAKGIPHYAGADSFVTAGAFATCGVNYPELGRKTADMAMDVLLTGAVPAFHVMEGGIITVNTDAAAALKLDYSALAAMADTLREVTTG